MQFFPTAEGYVRNTSTNPATHKFEYVYNHLDHLGNVRVSYAKNLITNKIEILEENNYYPFGLKMAGFNSDNLQPNYKFRFNNREWQDELGLNTTAMDYRQYDPAKGRFDSMDILAELAFSITPNRFAYNNPVYFSDPTGLFETRKEARAYRREHDITGSIVKNNDGGYSINDKKNSISYFRPESGLELSTTGSDGVATSALATGESSSSSPTEQQLIILWGSNPYGDLGGWKRGTASQSINVSDIPIMGGAARSVRGPNAFERMFSALKNSWDLWGKAENIESVSSTTTLTPGTIETQNVEPVKVLVPLYHYDVDDTPNNMPSVGRKGYHDTLINPSQRTVIDRINKSNYKKEQAKADALIKAKGL